MEQPELVMKFLAVLGGPLNFYGREDLSDFSDSYSYSYRSYVYQVSQGIALYLLKLAPSQPKGEGGRGYRSSSCPREGIAL